MYFDTKIIVVVIVVNVVVIVFNKFCYMLLHCRLDLIYLLFRCVMRCILQVV